MRGRLFRFPGRLGIAGVALALGAALVFLSWPSAELGMPPAVTSQDESRPRSIDPAVRPFETIAASGPATTLSGARPSVAGGPIREALDPDAGPITDPSTEQEYYEDFMRQGIGPLELKFQDSLKSPGPDCQRVALLRALYDLRSPRRAELFAWAIRTLPWGSTPVGESVPSFAVRFLGERAGRDPQARSALEQVAFGSHPPVASGLRRRAAVSLGATAGERALGRMFAQLLTEADDLVVAGFTTALERNPNTHAAMSVLAAFNKTLRTNESSARSDRPQQKERLP